MWHLIEYLLPSGSLTVWPARFFEVRGVYVPNVFSKDDPSVPWIRQAWLHLLYPSTLFLGVRILILYSDSTVMRSAEVEQACLTLRYCCIHGACANF